MGITQSNTKRSAETAYLKDHYPQNLVQFHKIGVKLQNAPEKENEVVVEPDVHFQIDGKEYLVFFNNHLVEINTVLNRWLENYFSKNYMIMPDSIKNSVKQIAEKGETDNGVIGFLKGFVRGCIPFYGQYEAGRGCYYAVSRIFSSKSQEDHERLYQLAYHIYKTKELIEKYGSEIQSGKICAICIEKNFNGKSEYITSCDDKLYQKLESKLFETMSSYQKSIDEKFNDLKRFLYRCENNIRPTLDEWRRLQFCFVINRVNYYLTREEELLIDKRQYEELKTMAILRSRLNQLAIKYKYLYLTNKEILLGITMSRFTILVDHTKCKKIFIESSNVREFYKKIDKRVNALVQILSNEYSFSKFTLEKIIETAQRLNPDKNQDFMDKLKKEINEKEEEREKLLGNATTEVGKVIIEKVESITDIAVSIYNIGSLIQQFKIKDIIDYMFTQNKIENSNEQQKEVKKENTNPPKPETNSKENTHTNEQQKDVKKENTNPPKPETNSKENKEIIQSSNTNKQNNSLHPLALNNTPLGIAIKAIKPTPEQLDKLHSSFNNFVDAHSITDEIESCQEQLNVLKKVQKLSNDFINLLKLNIVLQREWLLDEIDINEYLGIIVTEDNRYVANPETSFERKSNHKIYEIEKVVNYNEYRKVLIKTII
ncbi:hypothetical protein ENUP19_0352G0003 [Entamoeba nuttalli]|uniref:Uncharacterized protein n=1 Tax=Entamoeba nuttalli TaxID=412467 RepID=A0ABQ0DY76_9EUKA